VNATGFVGPQKYDAGGCRAKSEGQTICLFFFLFCTPGGKDEAAALQRASARPARPARFLASVVFRCQLLRAHDVMCYSALGSSDLARSVRVHPSFTCSLLDCCASFRMTFFSLHFRDATLWSPVLMFLSSLHIHTCKKSYDANVQNRYIHEPTSTGRTAAPREPFPPAW
jgi:hypothetical protein